MNTVAVQNGQVAPAGLADFVSLPEFVWYSPEWDMINVATKESGFPFENEDGQFHLLYKLSGHDAFRTSEFFLIGEL